VSGTQRLRLVLALGVVNLVLATVALGYGLSAPAPTPDVGAVPTAGTAFATTTPTAPSAANQAPSATPPAVKPAEPRQSENPGEDQTPGPSIEPSPVPSGQPSPVPPAPVVTQPTAVATEAPIAVVHSPAKPTSPQATPARPRATTPPSRPTPAPTKAPVTEGPGTPPACHASERGQAASHGKACHETAHKPKKDHHDNGRHRGAAARRPDGQADREPAIAETRPASKTRHRLRSGRRAR